MSEMQHLAGALVKAMAEVKNPAFDSTNPHYKNKFASLAAVRAAAVPVFAKHGLTILTPLVSTDSGVGVTPIIVHESGESMTLPTFSLPAAKHDPQGFGSAATYARRYALMAVAGVVGDDDDDGNAAQESHQKAQEARDLWKPASQRKHYSTEIQRLWGRGDAAGLLQLVSELNNDQQLDLWRDFNPTQQREIKELLSQARKAAQEEAA